MAVFAVFASSIQSLDISADRGRDVNDRTGEGESFCTSLADQQTRFNVILLEYIGIYSVHVHVSSKKLSRQSFSSTCFKYYVLRGKSTEFSLLFLFLFLFFFTSLCPLL